MAKRNKKLNYEQKIKEGRGSGSGKDYKPWIVISILIVKLRCLFFY